MRATRRSRPPWGALLLAVLLAAVTGAAGVARAKGSRPVNVVDASGLDKLLKRQHGHVVLLHLWASWCHPCLEELPMINTFKKEMKARGLEVLSVSVDDPRSSDSAGRTLDDKAPDLTRHLARVDDMHSFIGRFAGGWGGQIPAVFAFDKTGDQRGQFIGSASRQQLEELVGYMLKPPAAVARKRCPNGAATCS